MHSFLLTDFKQHAKSSEQALGEFKRLTGKYEKDVTEEGNVDLEKRAVVKVGKMDSKRHLEEGAEKLMAKSVVQCLGTMLDTVVF